eukprot:6068-Heterococcus_DN1.PRE.1
MQDSLVRHRKASIAAKNAAAGPRSCTTQPRVDAGSIVACFDFATRWQQRSLQRTCLRDM